MCWVSPRYNDLMCPQRDESGETKSYRKQFHSSKSLSLQWKSNIKDVVWQHLNYISIISLPTCPHNACCAGFLGFNVFLGMGKGRVEAYTVFESPPGSCVGVLNPKIHTSVHFLNSSTTCNKGCPPLPPFYSTITTTTKRSWITGFAPIRALLSWLKLYYGEIRETWGLSHGPSKW